MRNLLSQTASTSAACGGLRHGLREIREAFRQDPGRGGRVAAIVSPPTTQHASLRLRFLCVTGTMQHMRLQAVDSVIGPEGDELLTTGEAAKILNTSRQHVVDLCGRGDLPFVTTGTHRRVNRADVEALRTRTQRLTRDQRRSLWLGYAAAGKLVADPSGVMLKARHNLAQLKVAHSRGASRRWLDEWERLLSGTMDRVLETLTSRSPRARELRQNSPFAGVLTELERDSILSAFNAAYRKAESLGRASSLTSFEPLVTSRTIPRSS